jgi:hypothetical protein
MSATDLLCRCRALGIALSPGERGKLVWVAPGEPPADVLADLAANKLQVLGLLHLSSTWDPAEAERLLAGLRSEVDMVRAGFGGVPPAPLAMLLADALTIGERYIRDHEIEAARGWNALELLRDLVPHVRDLAARWTPTTSAEQTDARRSR